jgi:hypothetical protein
VRSIRGSREQVFSWFNIICEYITPKPSTSYVVREQGKYGSAAVLIKNSGDYMHSMGRLSSNKEPKKLSWIMADIDRQRRGENGKNKTR